MTNADQIALWALNAAELLKRAIAKSAYPAADGTADIDNDAIPILAAALEHHHARGRTAGFNEAKERDWLPIETAPKDGTFILLYCPEDNSRWLASWQGGNWYGVDELGLTRVGMGPEDVTGWRVTLWRPMPEPPATALQAMKQGGNDG